MSKNWVRIRPVSEADMDSVIAVSGGGRAHVDAGRTKRGCDYRLGSVVIEFKALDDDALLKPERQQKLAALFRQFEPTRPVIVLDPSLLPEEARRPYVNIIEGPIKGAIRSAKDQLAQSRIEHPDATTSVLMVVNNGYMSLTQDDLRELVVRRAKEYPGIDGVIVAGCYLHSDNFDAYFLPRIEYVPLNLSCAFPEFENLRAAWDTKTEAILNEIMFDGPSPKATKGPVVDSTFTIGGVTFVKPAPPIGGHSSFYGDERPRANSTGLTTCPPVGIAFAEMSPVEWEKVTESVDDPWTFGETHTDWLRERLAAASRASPLQPLVPVRVTCDGWNAWCSTHSQRHTSQSVTAYALHLFQEGVQARIAAARDREKAVVLPARYVLAYTEEIGQDRALDVSHIVDLRDRPVQEAAVRELLADARIFHEHAVALAAAYALAEGIDYVFWEKDRRYCWH